MDQALFDFQHVVITPWKLIGYLGTLLFTARWFVQAWATKKHRRTHLPMMFWWLSIVGSLLTLSYFIWGKNDSVGILQNAFPAFVAVYNVFVELRHRREREAGEGAPPA
jgi:lipid-A-disaccharide synthase-like uncharacterized protein